MWFKPIENKNNMTVSAWQPVILCLANLLYISRKCRKVRFISPLISSLVQTRHGAAAPRTFYLRFLPFNQNCDTSFSIRCPPPFSQSALLPLRPWPLFCCSALPLTSSWNMTWKHNFESVTCPKNSLSVDSLVRVWYWLRLSSEALACSKSFMACVTALKWCHEGVVWCHASQTRQHRTWRWMAAPLTCRFRHRFSCRFASSTCRQGVSGRSRLLAASHRSAASDTTTCTTRGMWLWHTLTTSPCHCYVTASCDKLGLHGIHFPSSFFHKLLYTSQIQDLGFAMALLGAPALQLCLSPSLGFLRGDFGDRNHEFEEIEHPLGLKLEFRWI